MNKDIDFSKNQSEIFYLASDYHDKSTLRGAL
jgi:hypothetical protein